MPTPKATKDKRVAEGKCSLCEKPLKSKRFCRQHLKYFSNYRKIWKSENKPGPPIKRCVVCRELGHDRRDCKDPRAKTFLDDDPVN